MKPFPRKLLSFTLAVGTAASMVLTPLAAVIGTDLHLQQTEIHQGTVLSQGVYWGYSANDKRSENFITYTPGGAVKPIVSYGDKIATTNTLSNAAKSLEAQGYRVVAGINGDYYYTSNGVPMGMLVTDGILRTGYNYTWAIGFMEDGTAIMGDPKVAVNMTYTHTVTEPVTPTESDDSGATPPSGETVTKEVTVKQKIYTVNKARSNSGIFLYTNDFNRKGTTGNTEAGIDVVLAPADGTQSTDLRIGQSLNMVVESVTSKSGATPVPSGKIVLSVNNNASDQNKKVLADLTPGTPVTISVNSAGGSWNRAKYITSGFKRLVENGEVVSGLSTSSAPRTAIGQKSDGSLVFYTIDGRQKGHSVGASEQLLAERLQQIGCTTALCLDGGGSTTITATLPNSTHATTINKPSEGKERYVSTHIFLVADNTPTEELSHYYISPVSSQVLAGTKVQLSATPVDTNYIPMQTDSTEPIWSADSGSIDQNGLFTTPNESGLSTVTFSNGSQSGTTQVQTVADPDSIVARCNNKVVTSITTQPDTTYPLITAATYNHMTLISKNTSFKYEVTGDIGTITNDGIFTATKDGTGSIVISAGAKSLTIPVTVSSMPFKDVPSNAWYFDAVKYNYEHGLMQGTTPTTFAPATNTSRSMIVQILYNKQGKPSSPYKGTFTDVKEGQWYAPAVEWAAKEGIVNGTGNGEFNPNGEVTREQMAMIFRNYAKYVGYDTSAHGDTSAFTDANLIHSWACESMSWAIGAGLLKGSGNNLNPLGTASRAEIAQVLTNFETIFNHQKSTDLNNSATEAAET